jgi:protein-tyrosine phosphatase
MRSILFVCTANICRSPTAEGVLRSLLARAGRGHEFQIASAGTHDYHVGEPPAAMAIEVARSRGYDLSGCTSRRIASSDFDHFDFILGMDKGNLANLCSIAPTRSKQKIDLLTEYADAYYGKNVPDPYGGRRDGFELALDMIEDACRGLAYLLVRQSPTAQGRQA